MDHASGAEIVLTGDPRIAAVPVQENCQKLVDIRTYSALALSDLCSDDAGAFAQLRAELLDRLVHADRALPDGVRLLIVEAHRPLALQQRYFDEYQGELRAANPDWDAERLYLAASRYVSPPAIAPHNTGGAVDLTLRADDGAELDMGAPRQLQSRGVVGRLLHRISSPARRGAAQPRHAGGGDESG